jgi:hypothetical protein
MQIDKVVVVTLLAVSAGQLVGVGASCAVILLDTAICRSACDVLLTDAVVSQLQLTGTLVSKVRRARDDFLTRVLCLSCV